MEVPQICDHVTSSRASELELMSHLNTDNQLIKHEVLVTNRRKLQDPIRALKAEGKAAAEAEEITIPSTICREIESDSSAAAESSTRANHWLSSIRHVEGNIVPNADILLSQEVTEPKDKDENEEEAKAKASTDTRGGHNGSIRHMEAEMYNAAIQGDVQALEDYIKPTKRGYSIPCLRGQTPTGNSILHLHVAAPINERAASREFIFTVLSNDRSLALLKNDDGDTPLHLAAKYGQLEAAELLFMVEPEYLSSSKNAEGDLALFVAVRSNQLEIVRTLLSTKFSVEGAHGTNNAGETVLDLAADTGCEDMLTFVLEKAICSPYERTKSTGSILHTAVLKGSSGMVTRIMEKYQKLVDFVDEQGETPVHYAAGTDNLILEVLLKCKSKMAAYIRDNEGRTPAHIAAQQDNVEGLKLLVCYHPDCLEISDNRGRNVAHYAAFLGCIDVLEYILKDIRFNNLVNKLDCDGNTPIHLIATSLKELPTASLYRLQLLLPELKRLPLQVYNKEKLTPGDIAHSIKIFDLEPAYQDIVRDFRKVALKGGRITPWLRPLDVHKLDIEAQRDNIALGLRRTTKNHMLVATLIATVSFTAGLTVPGGFDQHSGIALLQKNPAFGAFLISNAIALTCSITAILFYFFLALGRGRGLAKALFSCAFGATCISMLALMVAFMAGTYSILHPSTSVALLFNLIPLGFVFFYAIFAIVVGEFMQSAKKVMRRNSKNVKS